MKAGSEKEIGLAKKEDARITKVGKVLRKVPDRRASATFERFEGGDELDRTKTGERVNYYRLYDKTMPEFRYRLNVKAGLSGYAQVWGRYNTKLREKLMMDLMYIQGTIRFCWTSTNAGNGQGGCLIINLAKGWNDGRILSSDVGVRQGKSSLSKRID